MTTLVELPRFAGDAGGSAAPLRPVRLGIVGLGRAGLIHASVAAAIPNVELVGLADSRAGARRDARGVGFGSPVFDRLAGLIARTKPEAVIVAAPHDARPPLVREALEAGVAVLAERPIAPSLVEAESLGALARGNGTPFACAHVLPFHPVFAEVRHILTAGPLGAPRRVRASSYRSRVFDPARQATVAGGGSAGGVLAHDAMDALFVLLESFGMPRDVRATALRLFGPLEDEAHVMMTLPSGVEVGLDASWSVPGYPAPATVIEYEGDNGKLLASDDAVELDIAEARNGFRAGHARLGLADLPQRARFDVDGEASYLMDGAFLAWVAGGAPPHHRAERSLRAHRALDAIYSSVGQGGAAVPLSVSA